MACERRGLRVCLDFHAYIADAGLLGSAYDTAANTAHSAVTTGAGLVEKTANYIGDTAAKYSK